MKRKSGVRRIIISLFSSFFFLIIGMVVVLWLYVHIKGAPDLSVTQTTVYLDDQGEVIGKSSNGKKRTWVSLDEISPHFINAIIATEDRNFFEHRGVDLRRIVGATIANIKSTSKSQGASTISQQYARSLFLSHEKSWERKIRELIYTLRIEANYSKEEILEGYVNTIYFGHGMYGVKEASNYFFAKDVAELTIDEAALLASLPKGPNVYSPFISLELAQERQKIILNGMLETGKITEIEWESSVEAAINYVYTQRGSEYIDSVAPYFQDEVKKELEVIFSEDIDTLKFGGLQVHTTLNTIQQQVLEKAVNTTLEGFPELQTAAVAMNHKTGAVKAMVGGRDYEQSPFNRATQGRRQIGSTIKPLLYYQALENGFTPASLFTSESTSFTFDDGKKTYEPQNFNHLYANRDITMAQALAISDNIYAVKIHFALGFDELPKISKKLGITAKFEKNPSAALGTAIVRPIEIINAYNYFANGGGEVSPNYITKVVAADGTILYERNEEVKQVLSAEKVFVMSEMMKNMFNKGYNDYAEVTGTSIKNQLTRNYSGKSGSTSYDGWMIGYDTDVNVGVWVGYDKDKKIEKSQEIQSAKKIWASSIESISKAQERTKATTPTNVTKVEIDLQSGLLASEACPEKMPMYFVSNTEPTKTCPDHSKKDTKVEGKKENKNKSWFDKILEKIW